MRIERFTINIKEKIEASKAKTKEIVRKLADVPEYLAIGAGALLFPLSLFQPALMPLSLTLMIGGGTSMAVTEAGWPKKKFASQKI